jgi:hypothetical protein
VHNILRSLVALQNSTGLLLYAGGLGWGAEFKDYTDFHGRMIARTVNVGSPQVTAKVTTLEDLGVVRPVPPLKEVLEQAERAEVRRLGPMTNLSWTTTPQHNIFKL